MDLNKNQIPEIINYVVNADLCIGCGVCVSICESKSLTMVWSKYGLYEPKEINNTCNGCGECFKICPFSAGLGSNLVFDDENTLAEGLFLSQNRCKSKVIGQYISLYAGYSYDYRQSSSSGGIATWVLSKLLENKIVDHICAVLPNQGGVSPFFQYKILSEVDELAIASKTRYYPAHIADVMSTILAKQGTYAVVVLPCVIKALRLAQKNNPVLKERIKFIVGIICGGLKTAYYTEYLARLAGVDEQSIGYPEYRIKNPDSTAGDYSFGCFDLSKDRSILLRMRQAGDMWGTGLFKPNACDYCDDLSAELADLSVGDAWINPYRNDGKGTNILISRSELSESVLQAGLENKEILLFKEKEDRIILSQKGNYNHRRVGLGFRLYWAKMSGLQVPVKRVSPVRPYNPILSKLHKTRMTIRKISQEAWLLQRKKSGLSIFRGQIESEINKLRKLSFYLSLMRVSNWPSMALSAFKKLLRLIIG